MSDGGICSRYPDNNHTEGGTNDTYITKSTKADAAQF
jgi:hypothetical protein